MWSRSCWPSLLIRTCPQVENKPVYLLDFIFMCPPCPGQRVSLQLCPAHKRFMACGQHPGPGFMSFSTGGSSTSCQLTAHHHCTQHGRPGWNSRKAGQVQSHKSFMCYKGAGGKGAVHEETGASCRRNTICGCCSQGHHCPGSGFLTSQGVTHRKRGRGLVLLPTQDSAAGL